MSESGCLLGHLSMSATSHRSMSWGRRFMVGWVPRGLPNHTGAGPVGGGDRPDAVLLGVEGPVGPHQPPVVVGQGGLGRLQLPYHVPVGIVAAGHLQGDVGQPPGRPQRPAGHPAPPHAAGAPHAGPAAMTLVYGLKFPCRRSFRRACPTIANPVGMHCHSNDQTYRSDLSGRSKTFDYGAEPAVQIWPTSPPFQATAAS